VGNKDELVNPSAVIYDGHEQAMVQEEEDVRLSPREDVDGDPNLK
jgi:hypothetical protein